MTGLSAGEITEALQQPQYAPPGDRPLPARFEGQYVIPEGTLTVRYCGGVATEVSFEVATPLADLDATLALVDVPPPTSLARPSDRYATWSVTGGGQGSLAGAERSFLAINDGGRWSRVLIRADAACPPHPEIRLPIDP